MRISSLARYGHAHQRHVVLRLPPGADDAAIADAASKAGIRVPGLSAFRLTPGDGGGLS